MIKVLEYIRIILRPLWPILLVLALVVIDAPSAQAISLPQELPHRKVVVVDAGHGGHDIGAVGPSGLAEKVVTLLVAHKIKEILLGTYEVHLTRNDDYGIDIEHRTAVANHYRADIFVSIHVGGGFRHQARGVAIFYHSSHTGPWSKPPRQQRDSWEMGGVREAPCLVLRGADMPAILVEIGNLSHPADEKEFRKPNVISAAAEAICEGIKEYFTKYP
jgi:N-acetylmuramoyl-L-alanine amidase